MFVRSYLKCHELTALHAWVFVNCLVDKVTLLRLKEHNGEQYRKNKINRIYMPKGNCLVSSLCSSCKTVNRGRTTECPVCSLPNCLVVKASMFDNGFHAISSPCRVSDVLYTGDDSQNSVMKAIIYNMTVRKCYL